MKAEQLSQPPDSRDLQKYIPLIVDQRSFFETGKRLGSQSELFNEKLLQDNNLFRLAFRAGDNHYQFTNLSPSDYTAVLSWLEGTLEDNTSSLFPLMGAAAGFTVGIATSSFRTRRDFLKGTARTLGLTALGMAMSSCSPKERISLQTKALLQTATAIQAGEITPSPEPQYYRTPLADTTLVKTQEGYTILTSTPETTPSPTLTVTEVLPEYNFEAGKWAEKEDGTLNPQVMYPLVGAVYKQHHRFIDLIYNGMKIALAVDEDVTELNSEKLATKKNNQADGLNTEDTLKANLEAIRKTLGDAVDSYTVIVADGQITQVIFNDGNVIQRFHVDSEGGLTPFSKEEEPQLLPKLYIDGNKIKRADNREVVQFKGVEMVNPLDAGDSRVSLDYSKKLIDLVKSWEMNLIRLTYYTDGVLDDNRINETKSLIRAAEKKGMYVMLTPVSHKGEYLDVVLPNDEMNAEIAKLASELKRYSNVIMDVWNEIPRSDWAPVMNIDVTEPQVAQIEQTIEAIRSVNPEVIIGIPGGKWNRDFRYLRNHNLKEKYGNILLHVHDDPWLEKRPDQSIDFAVYSQVFWEEFIKDYPILIGEFGLSESYIFSDTERERMEKRLLEEDSGGTLKLLDNDDRYGVKATLKYINDNGLSYTQWVLGGWLKEPDLIISGSDFNSPFGSYSFSPRFKPLYNNVQDYPPYQFDK